MTRRSAMLGAVAAATGTAMSGLIPGQRTANASLPGKTAGITYKYADKIWWADADGGDPRVLATGVAAGSGTWAPDGSRFVYSNGLNIISVRADGSEPVTIMGVMATPVTEPAFTPDGGCIVYTHQTGITAGYATRDSRLVTGRWQFAVPNDGTASAAAVAADGTIVYQRGTDVYRVAGPTAVSKLITDATAPDFSPDGAKLAFVRGGQIWTANADGTGAAQLTTPGNTASTANTDPAWATNGLAILFTSVEGGTPKIKRIDLGTKTVQTLVAKGSEPTCQPVNRNTVERVWGQTALGTAVAASRYNWADHGVDDGVRAQAKAVVLSRDDTYFDALGGSALAIVKQGPLLITPPKKLDAGTQAELQRVLGGTGTVYLLGGTVALSAQVESQVTALGYPVVRLWGADEYATAIAIAKAITATPSTIIVATSLKYYDALAAGAAAGANPGTVVVLCAGDAMPATTAAYLNTFDPDLSHAGGTRIIAVGGPAMAALRNAKLGGQLPAWPTTFVPMVLYGQTEFETAVEVARYFFPTPATAAVATATTWFDALTGGAMIGANGGPLLLGSAGDLGPATQAYFSEHSGSLAYAVLLGGPLALKESLVGPLGEAISAPGAYDYVQYTETSTASAGAQHPRGTRR
ncbi:cell wall-binding repeat-containing protein [Dactylosporangium sp. NPDC049525]|uniref:cell wall-binding repeat-containing protein n=1 Tax=Dactylosporangium sp. NPDC049525 TaxID=3154730 RepID=UPI00341B6DF3